MSTKANHQKSPVVPGKSGQKHRSDKEYSGAGFVDDAIDVTGKKTGFRQWMKNVKNEYGYIGYAALISAAVYFMIYLARGISPFGDSTVLVLDLNGQYVYFFEALRKAVFNWDMSFLYSWERSLGGEFMGIYAYYLASPLSYIVCLFPEDMIQDALFVIYMIKAALCGATMGFYLHKLSVRLNKITVVAFSILYSTCSYCVVMMNNIMWIDAVLWLPLLVYGIEQLIKYGKYKLFVVSLAVTMMSNYYIGYMCCIFVALYFFFYMIAFKDNYRNNPRREENHFAKSLVRISVFSLLALAISAVIILTAYYSLQFGKNSFSDPNWEISLRFDFFDLLYKFLPGSYDTVRPEGFPFVYCGVLTLILVPVFFFSKKFTAREKIASAVFIAIFVLSFAVSTLDLIWHGFQRPNWLNARFAFMLSFFLIVLAFKAFDRIEEVGVKSLVFVAAFIGFFVIILQKLAPSLESSNEKFVVDDFETILLTLACLVAYLCVIAAMRSAKNKEMVATILLYFVCIEVFLNGLSNTNDLDSDVTFTRYYKYSEFQTLMRPITETIQDSDTSFYRMEKTEHRKTNDNMALSIRGLSNSTSTLNKDTIYFLRMMGYSSKSHWSKYLGGNPVSDSLLGIKYLITDRDYSNFYGEPAFSGEDYAEYMGMTLEELQEATHSDEYHGYSSDDYVVYRNPYALSLAFASSRDILTFNMKEHNSYVDETNELYNPDGYTTPFTRLNGMITAILGEDETIEVFKPAIQNGDPETKNCTATVSSNHHKYQNTGSANGTVTYTYTVPANTQLYLYLPAYYAREVKISSSTQKIYDGATTFYGNETGRIIDLGRIDGTEYTFTVTITSDDDLFYTKLDDSFIYYIDMDVFEDAFSRIQQNQLMIDEEYEEDDITGKITTSENNQLILTTIPYDEGWKVYVDGERVETVEALNALISFEVDSAGEHTIRFKYSPDSFVIGLVITLCASALFILIIVFEKRLKKMKLIKAVFVVEDNAPPASDESESLPEGGDGQPDTAQEDNEHDTGGKPSGESGN